MVHALGRAVRAAGCTNCRACMLRIFTEGLSRNATASGPRKWHVNVQQKRLYSIGLQQPDVSSHKTATSEQVETLYKDGGEERALAETVKEVDEIKPDNIPWYFNIEAPSRKTPSLSDRQKIPDLPESPPGILQPLLQRLSIDLGLDNLSLLDLRKLDPPPALGANLMMIIGTARSEKHLHVSADRLCRWLRSEYKLRPQADGLLGRGELQLKLKRKARRSKLLGNTNTEEDFDDGIRTGWVCVNVGRVDNVTEEAVTKAPSNTTGFVGFGSQTNGVKIVVQLLVEGKRQEIDLESLWNGIARRQAAPVPESAEYNENSLQSEFDSSRNAQSESHQDSSAPTFPAARNTTYSPTTSLFSPRTFQSRGYHSTARVSSGAVVPNLESTSAASFGPNPSDVLRCDDLDTLTLYVEQILNSNNYVSARRLVLDHRDAFSELEGEGWRSYFLQRLTNHLQSLPTNEALTALGDSWKAMPYTPFLLCFSQTKSLFPSPAELESIIQLYCLAMTLKHPGYGLQPILAAVKAYHLTVGVLPDRLYKRVFQTVLKLSENGPPETRALQVAMSILQQMQDFGRNLLTAELFLLLQESLAVVPDNVPNPSKFVDVPEADITTWNLPTLAPNSVQSRLHTVMTVLHIPFGSDATRMQLLDLYAKQYFWVEFWDFWRLQARENNPRSAALYAFMFRRVAATDHQQGCMTVLRTWVAEMAGEDPKVELQGDVLNAVEACLEVADPGGREVALNSEEARGEWVDLWRRCAKVRGWVAPRAGVRKGT